MDTSLEDSGKFGLITKGKYLSILKGMAFVVPPDQSKKLQLLALMRSMPGHMPCMPTPLHLSLAIKALCFINECKKLPLQLSRKVKGAPSSLKKGLSVCKICSITLSGSSQGASLRIPSGIASQES